MGNVNSPAEDHSTTDSDRCDEHELQGNALNNSEQKAATNDAGRGTERKGDLELHLDGEAEPKADTLLHGDGINIWKRTTIRRPALAVR